MQGTNWNVDEMFKLAIEAGEKATTDEKAGVESRNVALQRAMALIEDWRGEHREEMSQCSWLATAYPGEGEDVLPILKTVFPTASPQLRNTFAKALCQAFKDKQTADRLIGYFNRKPYSVAAREWGNANKKAKAKTETKYAHARVTLPAGVKIPKAPKSGHLMVELIVEEDGKPCVLIPEPEGV